MIAEDQLIQEPGGGWWASAEAGLEVFFEPAGTRPTTSDLAAVNSALASRAQLEHQAIGYIDTWVDRARPSTGAEYELRSVVFILGDRGHAQTKLQFQFPADEGSEWWVLFNNPRPPHQPQHWPVAFGRNQR